jgi:hypothetical protein
MPATLDMMPARRHRAAAHFRVRSKEFNMVRMFCLTALAAFLTVATVGCKSDNSSNGNSNDPKMMSNDACAHCPGKQTAVDGKCPVCGMKAKS